MKTVQAEVRLSFPIDNRREDRYATLTLTDKTSGIRVLELDLEGDALTRLLSGSGATVDVELIGDDLYRNVGKRFVIGKIDFDHSQDPTKRSLKSPTPEMIAFAEEAIIREGWESFRWQLHNYGWSLSGHRYDTITNTEEVLA